MRSSHEQRRQPTSYEDSRQKVAVKPQEYAGVQSSEPAQVEETSREEQDDLLERMLGRENLQLALKRVRQNGGAARGGQHDGTRVTGLAKTPLA